MIVGTRDVSARHTGKSVRLASGSKPSNTTSGTLKGAGPNTPKIDEYRKFRIPTLRQFAATEGDDASAARPRPAVDPDRSGAPVPAAAVTGRRVRAL
jgi:hypothetical protein